MTGMNDREKAFENKFAHDQDLKFRAIARRNKLLGLWAADLLGKADKDAYAADVVASDFEEAGDADVIRKVKGDLDAASKSVSEAEIVAKLNELLAVAIDQIQGA